MILLQTTTVQLARSESAFDILLKGGWILIPLLILSIVAIYFVVERFTLIKAALQVDQKILASISAYIRNNNYDAALKEARNYNHPIGRVIAAAIENPKRSAADMEQIMADEAKSEAFLLENHIGYVGSIATIAPMFGFLGTIFGVIKIFYNISLSDNISIGIIAGGLYQKMVSSAAGLTIGILAYGGFYYLNTRIDLFVHTMERSLNLVVLAIKDSKL